MHRALLFPALLTALAALAGCGRDDAARKAPAQPRAGLAAPAPAIQVTPASSATVNARPRPDVAARLYALHDRARVARGEVAPFLPLYRRAARHYGISWLLLASIHKQETAFSTARGTYHGLNFARCCAGPMQFNLTNQPVSTWKRFGDAFRTGPPRPARYPHRTVRHPSPYDDWDAILAAARLLAANGAHERIDGAAWSAAYLYYGPGDLSADDFGITYADEVVARALGWRRHGFCSSCATDPELVEAVHAAWATGPVAESGEAKERKRKARKRARARRARARRARAQERRERAERRAARRRSARGRREERDSPSAARDDREDAAGRRTPAAPTAPSRRPAEPVAPPAQTQPPPGGTQPPPGGTQPPPGGTQPPPGGTQPPPAGTQPAQGEPPVAVPPAPGP